MNKTAYASAPILVVSDVVTDAERVKKQLDREYQHVFVSTDANKAVKDFEWHKPQVLVLAFNTLEKAERYTLELQELSTQIHLHLHRTVILCNQDEVEQVCHLCQQKYFDDYVLFWPMTDDTQRLTMAIHGVLLELSLFNNRERSATDFAVQARSLAPLETVLNHQIKQCDRHITLALQAMKQARKGVDSVRQIDQFIHKTIGQQFHAVEESIQQLSLWAKELKQECKPHLESVRALNTLAERVRMTILVVDDDEFQHEFVKGFLPETGYHQIHANSGAEALNLLRKIRPDLILMDLVMPDMDGIEATRRIRKIPQLAGVPVIMVTGNSGKDAVKESIEAGATNFIVKPFDRATLLAKIALAMRP